MSLSWKVPGWKERNEQENDLIERKGELNLLLNLPVGQEVNLLLDDTMLRQADPAAVSFTDLSHMLALRPDLKMARANVNAAKANLKLQRSLAAPEFSVKGIYDRAGNFINNYKEEEYAIEKAHKELYSAYSQLQKAVELCRSSNDELEQNFGHLIEGVNENFQKRNISMLEFIDYYQSYKETCLQLYELKKNILLAMENLNTIVGQTVFNY